MKPGNATGIHTASPACAGDGLAEYINKERNPTPTIYHP